MIPSGAIISFKIGFATEVQSNLLDFGKYYIIQILIPSNSMDLKMNPVLIKQCITIIEKVKILNKTAIEQMTILLSKKISKKLLK